jgi:hypothetical protein
MLLRKRGRPETIGRNRETVLERSEGKDAGLKSILARERKCM